MKLNGYLLIVFLLCSLKVAHAQESIEATFTAVEEKVFIYYTIKGEPDEEYDVSVTLLKKSDPSFALVPSVLFGDFGKGKFAGTKRTILWQINPDEEKQMDGSDFFFKVTTQQIKKSGYPWYAYVGGAVVADPAHIHHQLTQVE